MKKMKLVALALCAPLILASCGNDTRAQVMAKAETYTLEKAAEKYGAGKHKTVTKFTVVKGEEAKVKALAISIPVPVLDYEGEVDVVINPLVLVGKDKLETYEADVKEESKKSETEYAVPSYTYADDKVTFQATYSKTLSEKKVSLATDVYYEWNDVGLFTSYVYTVAGVSEDEELQFVYTSTETFTWQAK